MVLLVLVLAVVVAADFGTRRFVEGRLRVHLVERAGFSADSDVGTSGWPFLTQLVARDLDGVELTVPSLATRSLRFTNGKLVLKNVTLPPMSALADGDIERVRVSSGMGTVEIAEADLNDSVSAAGASEQFKISDGIVSSQDGSGRIQIGVKAGSLVLRDLDGRELLSLELPPFGLAVRYRNVSVIDAGLRIDFVLARKAISLSRF